MDNGGGNRSIKNRSGSCSSCIDANVVTYDADVDQVNTDEDDHLNNHDDAIIESDDDDAGIFRIAHDYSSEYDYALADEQKEEINLSADCTRQTEQTMSRQQQIFCWFV